LILIQQGGVATPGQLHRAGLRIGRPALAARLNQALDGGSLLLVAGAGCGKTAALEESLAIRDARSAWLRCTAADADAGRLLRRLVQAVSEAAPGAVDLLAERLAGAQERIDARAVGEELAKELDRLLLDQLVIVLDDAEHLAAGGPAAALVGDLLAVDSAVLRLAVATRTALPLRLAKLRTAGRLTELGAQELAFSTDECGKLLRLQGRSDGDAERLFAATEGWPLGVSLGALHADVPSLRGAASRTVLFEFLQEEILERLGPELRALAIDSAITPELDRGVMRALRLPEDFADQLGQAGLPLRSAGDGTRLGYHPLVREFLLQRLEVEREPADRRDLHARVAPALAQSGRVEEAIEHWIAAESWSEAHRAIVGAAPPLLHSAPATVQRWIDALPAELRGGAWCLLLEGALDWAGGRQADAVQRLRESARLFTEGGDTAGMWLARFTLADPLFVTGAIREVVDLADGFDHEEALGAGITPPAVAAYAAAALGALGGVNECQALSRRLLDHPHSGFVRRLHLVWECYEHLLGGAFHALVPGAEHAIRDFERFDPLDRLAVVAGILPLALGDQGRDAEALVGWRRVEGIARERHSRAMLKVSLAWQALLHARGGAAGRAEELLARSDAGTEVGWRDYATDLARGRVASLRSDFAEAGAACERALSLAAQAPLSERFQATVDATPVLLEAGMPARARTVVGEALHDCDELVPGDVGRYSRALLLGLQASLRAADGDEEGLAANLRAMWEAAGRNAADVVRREWGLLKRPLWKALDSGILQPGPVIAAIAAAWPGGSEVFAFTSHPDERVRKAAVGPAASSGHPALLPTLDELAMDPEPSVAAAAAAARERLAVRPLPLDFTLLGGFEVRRGSWRAEDSAWDRRVAQRLVRYLLVKRDSAVADDLLLEAFWPDTPEPSARRSLKVAASCARAVLDVPGTPSVIQGAERTLAIRLREGDSVDVDRFEEAARAATLADPSEQRPLLERAASLWTGEPLPEERYSDWAAAWREDLTARYAEVLAALVAACHADEDHPAATQAARRLLELDPLDESSQRGLMTAYARSGRRAHALRQFLECRRRLVDQLGVEPAGETVELQGRILAGERV
jgi:DNA-binding SARP family transcriptional activator